MMKLEKFLYLVAYATVIYDKLCYTATIAKPNDSTIDIVLFINYQIKEN